MAKFKNINGQGKLSQPLIQLTHTRTSAAVMKMLINDSGRRHFHENAMTWSIRSRIRVARIHRINKNTANTLIANQIQIGRNGPFQPLRNSVVTIMATASVLMYSPMKNITNFIPEYSVK